MAELKSAGLYTDVDTAKAQDEVWRTAMTNYISIVLDKINNIERIDMPVCQAIKFIHAEV